MQSSQASSRELWSLRRHVICGDQGLVGCDWSAPGAGSTQVNNGQTSSGTLQAPFHTDRCNVAYTVTPHTHLDNDSDIAVAQPSFLYPHRA